LPSFQLLQLYVNGIKAANISNAMVVALDDATEAWLISKNVHHYTKKLVSRFVIMDADDH
jgi:hypothetical protein